LKKKTLPQPVAFFSARWDTWAWRWLFKLFFNRWVMGRLGRDPEFFKFVQGQVAERIYQRAAYALTCLATSANPYLGYILTGNFKTALPPYLEPEVFARLKPNLKNITWFLGPVDAAGQQLNVPKIDGYNLSDIFEYLNPEASQQLYQRLILQARPGARLVYWNMLAPRRLSDHANGQTVFLGPLSNGLHKQDRAFFYSCFIVEEVRA